MKLAYVSYEFPPDTAVGGIATYVHQTSRAMCRLGHCVEVFCASPRREALGERFADGVIVHRLKCSDMPTFCRAVDRLFAARHAETNFDLVESPEYGAQALLIKQRFADLPLVVKCHTPTYFVKRLNKSLRADSWKARLATLLGLGQYDKRHDREYRLALLADRISSPSISLGDHLAADWGIERRRIDDLPYLFVPQPELLEIPAATDTRTVTFLGRLEVRKGVVALAAAIPLVLRRHPQATFRFIGASGRAPRGKRPMIDWLQKKLSPHRARVEFIDQVPLDRVPSCLANTDVCVFPSLWENFPFVCLEAMSAARGIVASRQGGMPDMLADIGGGALVDPHNPLELAQGLIDLLDDPARRQAMGSRCREKIVRHYADTMVRVTEDYYAAVVADQSKMSVPNFSYS
jgi:glycogen synthase